MKRYDTDLTDEQWLTISSFIPKAKSGGRPRTTNVRRVVDAIFYVDKTGCQWRQLPHEFPPWQTVYRYFAEWQASGVVRSLQRTLYDLLRYINNREPCPSAVIIDSQSVKTGKVGGPRGYDGGKRIKGRKRHIVVDSQGLMVDVAVTPANVHDKVGGKKALTKALSWLPGRPRVLFADGGYGGKPFATWVKSSMKAAVEIAGNLAQKAKRFVPIPKRWVVERTFGWFTDYRRLDKDQERHMSHSCAMIRWAMIRLMVRRLD